MMVQGVRVFASEGENGSGGQQLFKIPFDPPFLFGGEGQFAGLVAPALQFTNPVLIIRSADGLGGRHGAALVGFGATLTLIAALFERVRGLQKPRLKPLLPPLDLRGA